MLKSVNTHLVEHFTSKDGKIYSLHQEDSGMFTIKINNRLSSIHSEKPLAQTRFTKYKKEYGKN